MKHITTLFASVVLAMCAATSAHAVTTYGTAYLPMDPGQPGVSTTSWSFSDQPNGAADDPFRGAHAINTEFDDLFIFNVPDTETISFEVRAMKQGTTFGVDFVDSGNGGYTLYQYADGSVLGGNAATNTHLMTGGSWTLTSGTYALEIAGVYAVKGGLYAGEIDGIPSAVPEASSAMMLLVGLAGLTGAARLRKNKVSEKA